MCRLKCVIVRNFIAIRCTVDELWQLQVLADISRLALCCHSNETRAPTANLSNRAQLQGTPTVSPNLHPGPCSSVGMRQRTDRHTERQTQTVVAAIHFASAIRLTRNVIICNAQTACFHANEGES